MYLNDSMRWLKPNLNSKADMKKKVLKPKSGKDRDYNNRTVIVFNPQLWKEEVVNLLED